MTDVLDHLKTALSDRYTIEREIGSGGMATVYHAQDLKHERQVAVKVLRPELAAALGPERFLQEIKIAANLHHPHILPLYDSGEADGFLYYVMPYVEGESLRDRLEREKQLAIDDALQVAREVADALSYAHAHGVIHRDIKPENILLESGHAVVADFGIARAVDAAGGERLTETGLAIGTPTYMSPEQAGGEKDLDGRSDLYSLGCVLHEMLAGQPPFTGPTVESLVHQHLSAEPPNVTVIRPSVPGWIAAALERSLAKTPADRFNPVAQFGEAISPRMSVAGDTQPVTESGRRRWLVPGVLAAALLVVIAVVLTRMVASGPISITTSNINQVTTEPGIDFQPVLSPDGREVAYIAGLDGRIVVRSTDNLGHGDGLRLGEEVGGTQKHPAWTTDGASLRFWGCNALGLECDWKEVVTRGGSVRSIGAQRPSDRHAWSQDGARVALAPRTDSIFAYSATGHDEPELLGRHPADAAMVLHSLAWSPDGRQIAYVAGNPAWRTSLNALSASIWVLDANGGEPVPVVDDEYMNVSPQWLPDSRHLLFVSNRDGSRGVYVIEVGPDGPRGPPQSVLPSSDAHSISISADGRRLAYAKFPAAQNIMSIPIPQSGVVSIKDAVPVTEGNQFIETHSLSPDGEWIAYESTIGGNTDIYKRPLTGEREVTLIVDMPGYAFSPQWSPDGSEIAFHSIPPSSQRVKIFIVPAAAGVPDTLPGMPGDDGNPVWSPDGLSIAFMSWVPGTLRTRVWVVSRDRVGGDWMTPTRLSDFDCLYPQWDPDGTSVWCLAPRDSTGLAHVRLSREGEVLERSYASEAGLRSFSSLFFSPDGLSKYTVGTHPDGSRGVWRIPEDGGDAIKVVAFDDPDLFVLYALTVGPEHLYLTVAKFESDIYVMDLEW